MHINFILEQLYVNTNLARNAFAGLSAADAARPVGRGNSMNFILGHLAMSRFYIARFLGKTAEFPYKEHFPYKSVFNKNHTYPNFEAVFPPFEAISAEIGDALTRIDPAFFNEKAAKSFPTQEQTNGAVLAFLLQHEAYHVGQLGLLRKQVGADAVSYTFTQEHP